MGERRGRGWWERWARHRTIMGGWSQRYANASKERGSGAGEHTALCLDRRSRILFCHELPLLVVQFVLVSDTVRALSGIVSDRPPGRCTGVARTEIFRTRSYSARTVRSSPSTSPISWRMRASSLEASPASSTNGTRACGSPVRIRGPVTQAEQSQRLSALPPQTRNGHGYPPPPKGRLADVAPHRLNADVSITAATFLSPLRPRPTTAP